VPHKICHVQRFYTVRDLKRLLFCMRLTFTPSHAGGGVSYLLRALVTDAAFGSC